MKRLSTRMVWFVGGMVSAGWLICLVGAGDGPSKRVPTLASAEAPLPTPSAIPDDGKLRIIAFGAHPDDCELRAGGVAAKWAAQGHHVKFVACTNGDVGHWGMAGGPLAQRRTAEVQHCADIFGIETEVLDIHDGELMPTLENRKKLVRLIRQWGADLVLSHRPNDYHPDHRYVGILVQDAAYMVTVPFFCPDTPYLQKNPVFMYYEDRFQRPNPFTPDVAVSTDDVLAKKLDAVDALESQFFEGGCNGSADLIPDDPAGREARRNQVRASFQRRFQASANRFRAKLAELYGKQQAQDIQTAEAFELCEYGQQPNRAGLLKLFPFFPER